MAALILIVAAGGGASATRAWANEAGGDWSTPVVISTNAQAYDPHLAVDAYGTVHAVWGGVSDPEARGSTDTLYYARWSEAGWDEPVDVFFSPHNQHTRFPAIAATNETLHIIWAGDMGNVYYSQSALCAARDARVWTQPGLLVDDHLNVSRVDFKSDMRDTLHVVYAQQIDRAAVIAYLRSDDNGATWSRPVPVSPYDSNILAYLPRLEVDAAGQIHVTWSITEATGEFASLGLEYARSADGGLTWSTPMRMAGAGFGRGTLLAVAPSELHLAWSGTVGYAGRYHRWSSDGGITWTETERLPLVEQTFGTGFPEMATDSVRTLHLLTGVEYMSYLSWRAGEWVSAQRIWDVDYSFGEPLIEGGVPRIVVAHGNRLIALWHDNWRIFFATKLLDGEPTIQPAPTNCAPSGLSQPPTPKTLAAPQTPALTAPEPAPLAQATLPQNRPEISPIIIGVGPALALVALVVIRRAMQFRRK